MRIFSWRAMVGCNCIADGYLLANDREAAEQKLKFVPFNDKYEKVELDDDDCGSNGCEIDNDGIAIRWMD